MTIDKFPCKQCIVFPMCKPRAHRDGGVLGICSILSSHILNTDPETELVDIEIEKCPKCFNKPDFFSAEQESRILPYQELGDDILKVQMKELNIHNDEIIIAQYPTGVVFVRYVL